MKRLKIQKTYQKDQASIDRLLAEAEESAHKLRDLVRECY